MNSMQIFKHSEFERLVEILMADKEGRVLILPSRNDEKIHNIEMGLGFKLFDWQKAYIFGLTDYKMPGRGGGRTTAHILKVLLSEGEPIKMYESKTVEIFCDEYHGSKYYQWYKGKMREIYRKLSNPSLDLKLRKIYFSINEKNADEADNILNNYGGVERFIYKGEK